jgi:hypothetical protein
LADPLEPLRPKFVDDRLQLGTGEDPALSRGEPLADPALDFFEGLTETG